MEWFKHKTDANMDAKLQELLLDYGLEGYGLYWYLLELEKSGYINENVAFYAEKISKATGTPRRRVVEMMLYIKRFGLLDNV